MDQYGKPTPLFSRNNDEQPKFNNAKEMVTEQILTPANACQFWNREMEMT